jgi:hypothetical protein
MIIDTIRPNGTTTSNFALTGGATLHAVTSDNNDATYGLAGPGNGFAWQQFPNHTPAADHERHLVRWRVRSRQDDAGGAGFTLVTTSLEGPTGGVVSFGSFSDTESPVTHAGVWVSNEAADLDFGGAISFDLKHTYDATKNTDEWRVLETYIDIDTREKPTFTADILDGAGVSRDGGTVTDTPAPTLEFGVVDYDGLPSRIWSVVVRNSDGVTVFSRSESGSAPSSLEVDPLPNGDYEADLQVFSTIRVNDSFASDVETVTWTQNFVAPASPVLTSTPVASPPSVDLDWVSDTATATTWDVNADVVTEIERVDCNGIRSFYMEQTGIGAVSHIDRFMSLCASGPFCGESIQALGMHGTSSGQIVTPDSVPLSITGDIDLRADVSLIDWTSKAAQTQLIINKANSYALAVGNWEPTEARLIFVYVNGGPVISIRSLVPPPFGPGQRAQIRATHDVNNGAGSRVTTFYYDIGDGWVQLGDPVVFGTAGAIDNTANALVVGAVYSPTNTSPVGHVFSVEVRNGINGTVVASPDFTDPSQGWVIGDDAGDTGTDDQGNVWTLAGDGTIEESCCMATYRARYWGLVDDILVASEWSDLTTESIDNPTPGNAWLRGAASGDLSACPDEDYGRFRPFGVFQPIDGGIPTVITGAPSGRNYNLNFALTSEADLVTLEAILAQPLFFYQPVGQADLWLAPNQSSIQVVKVGRARRLQVDTVAVNPQPVADPASFSA